MGLWSVEVCLLSDPRISGVVTLASADRQLNNPRIPAAAVRHAALAVELSETRHVRNAFKITSVKADRQDAREIPN